MKQKVLDKTTPHEGCPGVDKPEDSLLAFLKSLCGEKDYAESINSYSRLCRLASSKESSDSTVTRHSLHIGIVGPIPSSAYAPLGLGALARRTGEGEKGGLARGADGTHVGFDGGVAARKALRA
jgi:hypothetical protein